MVLDRPRNADQANDVGFPTESQGSHLAARRHMTRVWDVAYEDEEKAKSVYGQVRLHVVPNSYSEALCLEQQWQYQFHNTISI